MTTMLLAALGIGFLGSLHCVGMCGPIVLCLPREDGPMLLQVLSRLAYNLGRVVTYAAMGAVCGVLGKIISLAGYQNALSIAAGVAIAIAVLLPSRISLKLLPQNPVGLIVVKIRNWWSHLLTRKGLPAMFGIGLLNGFLPCGFLYLGLAAASTTASAGAASLYMVMFGLGTVPALLITSVFAGFVRSSFRRRLIGLMPVAALAMAALLVIRGLSLGIPYLSPRLHVEPTATVRLHDCCK
jgi:uncharacterized protein